MGFRFFWILRAVFYKLYFKKISLFSYIGKPTFIKGFNKISIGKKVRIFPGLRAEVHGKNSFIKIEDNVSIGQNFHIISGGNLIIGEKTTISGNVFITNISHTYEELDKHILEQINVFEETYIGANSFIGYGTFIQSGTKLGKQCIVGANSVVKGEFPDYCVIAGAPARIIKKYNSITKKWEKQRIIK